MSVSSGLESALSMLHSEKVHKSFQTYHESLQQLTDLFYTDPNWQVHLHGDGYDNTYPSIQLWSSPESYVCLTQPRPRQLAVFRHKKVTVLQDNAEEYKAASPLLFYMAPSRYNAANVQLYLSARAHSLIVQNEYGLSMENAINVKTDESGMPRFFLSSVTLNDECITAVPDFIMVHTETLIKLPKSLNRLLNEDFSELRIPGICLTESTYALNRIVAFHCPQWPDNAKEWRSRKKSWLPNVIVEAIIAKGCLIVPATITSKETQDEVENEWSLSFLEAERELCGCFTPKQHLSYLILKDILSNHLFCSSWITEVHMKHAMFWILEQETSNIWQTSDATSCFKHTLKAFQKFFLRGKLPHYFIPQVDLFETVCSREDLLAIGNELSLLMDLSSIDSLYDPFAQLLQLWDLNDIAASQLTDIQHAITCHLHTHFQASFDKHIGLFYLLFYARRTSFHSTDLAISKAKDALQLLSNSTDMASQFMVPMKEVFTNILGNLYLVKAMATKPSPERKFFVSKAEECLLLAHNMDLLAGKVKLANFFFMTSRFTDCIQLMEEVLQHAAQWDKHYTTDHNTEDLRAKLWLKWINKNYVHCFVISGMEKSVVPLIVKQNLNKAVSTMLGLAYNQVVYFDADVYSRILLVLSLIKLDRKTDAVAQLDILENLCEKEHDDSNEKRSVAYLNIVAHCYELLGEREKAVHVLCRSLSLLPNPSNSARWSLMKIQTEKTRTIIKGSLGTAAAVGLVAVLVAVVKGRIQ